MNAVRLSRPEPVGATGRKVRMAMRSLEGHRASYHDLFTAGFARASVEVHGGPLRLRDLFARPPLFVPMLEEYTAAVLVAMPLRALFGRRTVALLFRPRETVAGTSVARRLKRAVLRMMVASPRAAVLTILRFDTNAAFAGVARDWIDDPQLWDLDEAAFSVETPLATAARALAGGRPIVVALGYQSRDKGFERFARLWNDTPSLRAKVLFAAAGRLRPDLLEAGARMRDNGAMVEDALVSDDDLLALYRVASLVWSAYSPGYDQASGIFGRAVQFGVPAVVRAGSLIEADARQRAHPVVALPDDDAQAVALLEAALAQPRVAATGERVERVAVARRRTERVLGTALGLPLEGALG